MEDRQIVDLFLERNESAVSECSAKYSFRLRRLSLGIVGSHETAEECENDTYMKAWNSIPPNKPYEYLFSYLACIIRRLSIDRCKHEKRLKRDAEIMSLTAELEECFPSSDTVERHINDREFITALNEFLDTQPPEKRSMFVRRYFYTDSMEEIARRYSVSTSKVASALYRMRNALRKRLTELL